MTSYVQHQQSWGHALITLAEWIQGFREITNPEDLSFDHITAIMGGVPQGMQSFPPALLDSDAVFIDAALHRCLNQPSEVIVIPDCGMVSRLPFRLSVSELTKFVNDFEYKFGEQSFGLLDGASDIFFGFDTGDMLLVDHDERIWFSPSPISEHR